MRVRAGLYSKNNQIRCNISLKNAKIYKKKFGDDI